MRVVRRIKDGCEEVECVLETYHEVWASYYQSIPRLPNETAEEYDARIKRAQQWRDAELARLAREAEANG